MATTPTPRPNHPVTQDIPLPGHYQCLTLQTNLTIYPPTAMARFVTVVREPNDQIEIVRFFRESGPWPEVLAEQNRTQVQAIANMTFMAGWQYQD